MISVEQAIARIEQTVHKSGRVETLSLSDAVGCVLARDVMATIDLPSFRQSAMDGYALKLHNKPTYKVVAEVAAGSQMDPALKPGEAARIFTGAPVPKDADSIVIQERVKVTGDEIDLEITPGIGDNIRPIREQIKRGQEALPAGLRLNPAALGLLAGFGIAQVAVSAKPKVAIVVTGDELMPAGVELAYGQIYESNGIMLWAALAAKGYQVTEVYKAKDELDLLKETLQTAFNSADVVLISGGISVGDYDFAQSAMAGLGVEQVFYKIRQKPGKPLYFGKKADKLVFALPGNPASALSCFYRYVLLALRLWEGDRAAGEPYRYGQLRSAYIKKGDRAQFLKAKVESNDSITILDGQASSMLQSFARANALVYLNEEVSEVSAGTIVPYLKID